VNTTLNSWAELLLNNSHVDLLFISIFVLFLSFILLRLQRLISFERQRREENERQLLNALQRITQIEDSTIAPPVAVAAAPPEIDHAELKTRLQTPVSNGNAPSKYRHVASLAQQGMSDGQIAEVLNLSEVEVRQLVTLASIAVRND